jgi:flagellar hook-length control protein FliK
MIEGLGLSTAAAAAPAAGAAVAPPAGLFLQLLAGGFAAPAPASDQLAGPAEAAADDAVLSEEDPAGFLSAWFGLALLPPVANEALIRDPRQGSDGLPSARPATAVPASLPAGGLPGSGAADTAGRVQPPLAEALAQASAQTPMPEGAAAAPASLAPGVEALIADPAMEGFASLVQDPGAAPAARAAERAAAAPAAPSLNMDADFEAAFEAQLRWQVESGLSEAVIDLNPAELGALTIRIQMHGDQTSLQIHAAEAATRQLLQQLLPQMGERLAQSGLFYSGGEVRERSRAEAREPSSPGAGEAARSAAARRLIALHLVDAYV